MDEAVIIVLLLLLSFGGFVFFVWSLILLFCINSNQNKTFKMLSSLMQQMAVLKKTVISQAQEKPVPEPEVKLVVKPEEITEPVKAKPEPVEKKEILRPAAAPVAKAPSKSEIVRGMATQPKEESIKEPTQLSSNDVVKTRTETPARTPIIPPEPPKPSAFEEKAGYILKKIWNWIVVGEEFRNPEISMEYAVASAWLLRSAIVILIAGIYFIVDYSIDKEYLGDTGKFSGAVLASLLMLGCGLKLAGKKYHAIAQGLIGGGIASLYVSIFAGWKWLDILDTYPAFGLMILITIAAGVISIRLNSLLIAVFGVIGGYCTPALISTGTGNLPGLYTYLILLGICTLVIARYRDWKLLNFLSYGSTIILFFLSMYKYYEKSDFTIAISFLSLSFILFSFIPILYNLVNKHKSTVIELIFMFTNSSLFAILSYILVRNRFGSENKEYYAIVTIGMALFYIGQILFFMRKKLQDRNFLIILSGLASVFITLTLPSLLSDEWLTAAWAIQAAVFMWMSSRIKSNFIRVIANILYLITFGALLIDMGRFRFPEGEYFPEMMNRFITMGVTIVSLIVAYFILKKEKEENNEIPEYAESFRENDFGKSFGAGSVVTGIFFWLAFAFVFVYLHIELFSFCKFYYPPMRFTILSFIWLGALLYIFTGTQKKKGMGLVPILYVGIFLFMIKLLFVDLISWEFLIGDWRYAGPYSIEDGFMRLLDFIPAVAFFAYAAFIAPKRIGEKEEGSLRSYQMFGVLSLSLLFMYTSLELSTFLIDKTPGFRSGGISILWGLFAIAFVLFGILKDSKALRYSGLALFVIVSLKVFIVDMAKLEPLYKIIAFIVLGLIILGGSFIYVKFKDFFETSEEEEKEKKV